MTKARRLGPNGEPGSKPRRRFGLEALGATRAHASVQAHSRDVGGDRGNLDPVVDLARLLRTLRDIGSAMPAHARQDVAPTRRVRMQRPVRAMMRLPLLAVVGEFGRLLLTHARRDARIVRRLGRTIQLRPQLGDRRLERGHLRAQPLDRLRLRQGDANQSFPVQRIKRGAIHAKLESEPDSRVKFSPQPTDKMGGEQLLRKRGSNRLNSLDRWGQNGGKARLEPAAVYPAQPCSPIPANRMTPASRLERKSRSAVSGSAPSTCESCQPRWPA